VKINGKTTSKLHAKTTSTIINQLIFIRDRWHGDGVMFTAIIYDSMACLCMCVCVCVRVCVCVC